MRQYRIGSPCFSSEARTTDNFSVSEAGVVCAAVHHYDMSAYVYDLCGRANRKLGGMRVRNCGRAQRNGGSGD
jgi:hypothetical protein